MANDRKNFNFTKGAVKKHWISCLVQLLFLPAVIQINGANKILVVTQNSMPRLCFTLSHILQASPKTAAVADEPTQASPAPPEKGTGIFVLAIIDAWFLIFFGSKSFCFPQLRSLM